VAHAHDPTADQEGSMKHSSNLAEARTGPELDRLSVDALRMLAVDMVENAKSGHPGMPLGAAPMAYVLWTRFLRHNPENPAWWDRDRFVLSAGHGSALLYALLHLTGYRQMTLDELQRFRQWKSATPGHPEPELTEGVEATTGPLGQGVGNAVGMAIAEAQLAARYNRPGHALFDHRTFVIASDGDLMEGVASESSSLAGQLRLGRLVVLFDDNGVTLSGTTSLTFNEDVGARYEAYGWHVQRVPDGNDLDAIERALAAACAEEDRPSIILVRTILGYGAPGKQGTFGVHGNPLGAAEMAKTKQRFGWPLDQPFFIPAPALAHFREAVSRGRELEDAWRARFAAYERAHPDLAAEIVRRFEGRLPEGWEDRLPIFPASKEGMATRKASEEVLQALAAALPELTGGSGDLDASTLTWMKGQGDFEPGAPPLGVQGAAGGTWGYAGRNIHFGVREHAMGAAVNGLAGHGGFIPFGATFLIFHDYMRAPVRLSAIARLGSIWVYTHDSIGVGEDGPTHQPVEHLAALRAIPNLVLLRPCDANETRFAWQVAVEERHRPTALVLTRQAVPTLDRAALAPASLLRRGAYVLRDDAAASDPDLVLIASGSEVALIVEAGEILNRAGVRVRLVSMPSWELFEEQSRSYQDSVLPPRVTARLAVEAASPFGWERWTGSRGAVLGVSRFGASAPGKRVLEEYGFTARYVADRALAVLSGAQAGD
jgi:transketolase